MIKKFRLLIDILKGNAIVIQKKSDTNIYVECGRNITREFAKQSLVASFSQLK